MKAVLMPSDGSNWRMPGFRDHFGAVNGINVPKGIGSVSGQQVLDGKCEPDFRRPGHEKALKTALNLREGPGVIS